jgi:hypothetical protein
MGGWVGGWVRGWVGGWVGGAPVGCTASGQVPAVHQLLLRGRPGCCPLRDAGGTIYMPRDWWAGAYPQHVANTGVLIFANTPHLPQLLTTWLDAALLEQEDVVTSRCGRAVEAAALGQPALDAICHEPASACPCRTSARGQAGRQAGRQALSTWPRLPLRLPARPRPRSPQRLCHQPSCPCPPAGPSGTGSSTWLTRCCCSTTAST